MSIFMTKEMAQTKLITALTAANFMHDPKLKEYTLGEACATYAFDMLPLLVEVNTLQSYFAIRRKEFELMKEHADLNDERLLAELSELRSHLPNYRETVKAVNAAYDEIDETFDKLTAHFLEKTY